ncbi:MAG: hypothetical protein LBH59_09075 [Planctomycetaceae bacterium]|nr:hypothetical protein [Planctomycetaceae bacterium]
MFRGEAYRPYRLRYNFNVFLKNIFLNYKFDFNHTLSQLLLEHIRNLVFNEIKNRFYNS